MYFRDFHTDTPHEAVESQQLCDLLVNTLGGGGRCPPLSDVALLVDQELLKVPLDTQGVS